MDKMNPTSIPVNDLKRHNAPLMPALAEAARAVVESGWYVLGPQVRAFEEAFARYCGAAHCVGTGNGTDALELALRALGAGDRVATVANAGGYGTTAILAAGAEPLFVDVSPGSMLMDARQAEAAIASGARAVLVTHLYGRMAEMPAIFSAAAKAGIPVIEDCAQAHGAVLDGRHAGTWGACGCFSFYPTKNLGALGDGGAVITNDAALAARVRELRQYGWTRRYHSETAGGRNSRLDEMQAAILLAKLPHLDGWNRRRREIANAYTAAFRNLPLEAPAPAGPECVAHLYPVRTREREALAARLAEAGVGTDIHYPTADYMQDAWRAAPWAACRLPETERCCREVLTLPCFPELTDEEVQRVVAAMRQACRSFSDPPRTW